MLIAKIFNIRSTSALVAAPFMLALLATNATAKDKIKYGDLSVNGKLQLGVATDRNAGNAPLAEKGGSSSNNEEGETENEDLQDGDLLQELDLEGQDVLDQLDDTEDENGDGNFFNDDDAQDLNAVDVDGDGDLDIDVNEDGLINATDDLLDDAVFGTSGGGRKKLTNDTIRDERLNAQARLGFNYAIGSWAKEWKTGLAINSSSFNTLSNKDSVVFGANTGPVFEVKSLNMKIQPSISFANFSKDGTSEFNNYGAAVALQYDITKQWQLSARYGNDLRYFNNDAVDKIKATSGAAVLKYKIDEGKAVSGGYIIRYEDTDVAARGKIVHQFLLGYEQKFDYGLYVRPQAGYAYIERNGAVKAGQVVRKDNRTVLVLAAGKNFENGINVELQYSNMDLESNIDSKNTSNDRFVLLSGWKF